MKVSYILKKALRKKGEIGDVVKLAKGFGRYLEGCKIAVRATKENLLDLEERKLEWKKNESKHAEDAKALMEKIKDLKLKIEKRVGQNGKLYEAIRPEHVVDAFKAQGFDIPRNYIRIDNQIKNIGEHKIIVHAYGNYECEICLDVVPSENII